MLVQDNFFIEDLIYVVTNNHVPVMIRPYIVNTTKSAIDTIADRMYDNKSGKITPNIINGVTNEIIQPSSVGFVSKVDSTWVSNKRFIFLLKVKTIDSIGTELNSYIQGFTEYDGITNTGNIDLNMIHHINTIIETINMTINTPLGIIRKEKLYKIYNVFASYDSDYDLFTQRPNDVLENINIINMANTLLPESNINSYSVANLINPFNQNVVASNIDNNITTEYLSKILTTGILVNKSRDIHLNSYDILEQNSIESKIPEPSISDNRFIKYLCRLGGFKTTREVFTFNQLMQMDNTIYNRFKLINLTKDIVNPITAYTPEVGDYWYGQDIVTIKAYSLIENSVAMALKYGFNKLYFTASNMSNPTGIIEVFITNFNSFINLDEHDFNFLLEIFKEKFITEIFLNETNQGVIPTHADFYIDLLGTTKINLSYAGYSNNWYTVPTFANSLFSPIITVNKNTLDYTSQQLDEIINTLSNEHNINREYY